MTYYSTGIGTHLPKRKTVVECNEITGNILVTRGFLVINLSELDDEVKEKIEIPVEEIKPKKKGNPNWGKK